MRTPCAPHATGLPLKSRARPTSSAAKPKVLGRGRWPGAAEPDKLAVGGGVRCVALRDMSVQGALVTCRLIALAHQLSDEATSTTFTTDGRKGKHAVPLGHHDEVIKLLKSLVRLELATPAACLVADAAVVGSDDTVEYAAEKMKLSHGCKHDVVVVSSRVGEEVRGTSRRADGRLHLHRDIPRQDLPDDGGIVAGALFVVDCTEDTGCTEFFPGSQHVSWSPKSTWRATKYVDDATNPRVLGLGARGSVWLFDATVLHRVLAARVRGLLRRVVLFDLVTHADTHVFSTGWTIRDGILGAGAARRRIKGRRRTGNKSSVVHVQMPRDDAAQCREYLVENWDDGSLNGVKGYSV